jgi:hypothetical protein
MKAYSKIAGRQTEGSTRAGCEEMEADGKKNRDE